jgi:hypothetical protein
MDSGRGDYLALLTGPQRKGGSSDNHQSSIIHLDFCKMEVGLMIQGNPLWDFLRIHKKFARVARFVWVCFVGNTRPSVAVLPGCASCTTGGGWRRKDETRIFPSQVSLTSILQKSRSIIARMSGFYTSGRVI